jgi:hypothetical protein
MESCVFCQIIGGESPAKIVHRDERVTAFRDKHPAAPTHILIVPNRHIQSVNELAEQDEALMGYLFTIKLGGLRGCRPAAVNGAPKGCLWSKGCALPKKRWRRIGMPAWCFSQTI